MKSTSSAAAYRVVPPLAVTTVAGAALAFWLSGAIGLYRAVWYYLGVAWFRFPFLDTHAVLAAMDCHRRGFDVYVGNPCDVLDRPHVYSPLWLWIGDVVPVSAAWTPGVGLALCAVFLVSLFLLPTPRSWGGTLFMAAAMTSWSVGFALERGNSDLVVFILVLASVRLLQGTPALVRAAGYAMILLAGLLKFYPVVALVLLFREKLPGFVLGALACAAGLGVFALYAYGDMTRILPQIPGFGAFGWDMFGAANLTNRITTALSLTPVAGLVLKAVCVAGAAVIALRLAVSAEMGAGLSKLTDAETLFLLAGAALIVGCFFAGPSIGYRGVLLLLALPGLMALRRAMPGRIQRLGLSLALAASLLVMCLGSEIMLIRTVARWIGADDDTIGMALTVEWIVSQAAWWWLATTLLSVVAGIVLRSRPAASLFGGRIGRTLLRDARPGTPPPRPRRR